MTQEQRSDQINRQVIFCGDIALPFGVTPDYSRITDIFEGCQAIANLEGAILDDEASTNGFRHSDKFSLYSSPKVIKVLKDLRVTIVSLCNNHILDYKQPIDHTIRSLAQNGIGSFGIKNHDVIEIPFGNSQLFVVTFATYASEHSLQLFSPGKVIREVSRLRVENPAASIVIYPHWGREKFHYPDPADRELAHRLIDNGADLIVGHHPHVVQPVEVYKGKHIIYSVGNLLLAQGRYGKHQLSYRSPSPQPEIIVKWDGYAPTVIPLQFHPTDNILMPADPTDFNTDSIPSDMTSMEYLKLVMSKSGILDRLVRTRCIPGKIGERICYAQRRLLQLFRRLLISLRIHTPK